MAMRHVLTEQVERSEKNIEVYRDRLAKLPKGTLHQRKRGGKVYYYLKYRDESGKRVDQYIKADQVDDIRRQLSKRKELLGMIKGLQEDIKIAKKALK